MIPALPEDHLDTMVAALPPTEHDDDERQLRRATAAVVLLRSLGAREPIEAILATQAVLAHHTVMQCLRRSARAGQPAALTSRLLGRAPALSNAFVRTVHALRRRQNERP